MTEEKQLCSLELAKELKELGVKQESLFFWSWYESSCYCKCYDILKVPRIRFFQDTIDDLSYISAFSVAELGEMLPEKTCWRGYTNYGNKWAFEFGDFKAEAETEADARAKMLIYLLKNKLCSI